MMVVEPKVSNSGIPHGKRNISLQNSFFLWNKIYISIFLLMVISSYNMYIGPGREIDNAFRGKYKLPNDLKNTRTLPNLL